MTGRADPCAYDGPYPNLRPVKIKCGCVVRQPDSDEAVAIALGDAEVKVYSYCETHRTKEGELK